MKISATTSTYTSFALLIALSLGASLVAMGCKDDLEAKSGAVGEFCFIDDDCRQPLVCNNGSCQDLGTVETDECDAACDHIESCNVQEANCVANCEQTVLYWRAEAIDVFTGCLAAQTCEALGSETWQAVRQGCYSMIPLDETREDTCYRFQAQAGECAADSSTDAITQMTKNCLKIARTRPETNADVPLQAWSNVTSCIDAVEVGVCSEIVNCLNDVFLKAPDDPKIVAQ